MFQTDVSGTSMKEVSKQRSCGGAHGGVAMEIWPFGNEAAPLLSRSILYCETQIQQVV